LRNVTQNKGVGGQLSDVYSDIQDRAKVKELRAAEGVVGNRLQHFRKIQVGLRRRTDVTTNMRIVWQNEEFEIKEIQPQSERSIYMTVFAEGYM